MIKFQETTQSLWAKKSTDNNEKWLPLIVHLRDADLCADNLWEKWLSKSVKSFLSKNIIIAEESDPELEAKKLFKFVCSSHDLGKATPVFALANNFIKNPVVEVELINKLVKSGLSDFELTKTIKENRVKIHHSKASQILLESYGVNERVSSIVGSHHGKPYSDKKYLRNSMIESYKRQFRGNIHQNESWNNAQSELLNACLLWSGFESVNNLPLPNQQAQFILAGLVIMVDWIVSNELYFPLYNFDYDWYEDFSDTNCLQRVEKGWNKLGLSKPWQSSDAKSNIDLYSERFSTSNEKFNPRPMQKLVMQLSNNVSSPGIMIIEAPMGQGKTEAALVAAEIFAEQVGASGIYFALPTQATTNGLFPRILKWIERLDDENHTIKLLHSKAQFNETYIKIFESDSQIDIDGEHNKKEFENLSVHSWFQGQKKSLLSDFVVGTVDHILLAALKQKHLMLRHVGLAGKVVIIDECHAYDAYMNQYLGRALSWLGSYGVPVILLSATLPEETRNFLVSQYCQDKEVQKPDDKYGYPLITYSDGDEVSYAGLYSNESEKDTTIYVNRLKIENLLSLIDDKLSDGGNMGIIVNTVKQAQDIYDSISAIDFDGDVKLFHSQFLAPDRMKKEDTLLKELGPESVSSRPYKGVIIGTQVLEQSLNIDFDILVSELCPMDLLIQRVGRLHRFRTKRPEKLINPELHIFGLEDDISSGTKKVYGECLLERTKRLLPNQLTLPKDIPALVQHTYDLSYEIPELDENYYIYLEKHQIRISHKESKAQAFLLTKPSNDQDLYLQRQLDFQDVQSNSEQAATAQVRDSGDSLEIILLKKIDDDCVTFAGLESKDNYIYLNYTPDYEQARRIAQQTIRLPFVFCLPSIIDKTISVLEEMTLRQCPEFLKSPWLEGQLFLILDENNKGKLLGYDVSYSMDLGFQYSKEREDD